MDENKREYEPEEKPANKPFDDTIEDEDLDIDIEDEDVDSAGMEISVEAASLEEAQAPAPRFNIWKVIREWVFSIVLALLVVVVIKGFLFDFVVVDGRSMQTTLMDGDRLILTKMGYQPRHGDIIVLDSHYKSREAFIAMKKETLGDSFGWFDEFKLRWLPWEQKKYSVEPRHYVKRVIGLPGDTIDIDEATGDVYVNGEKIDQSYLDEGVHTYRGRETQFPYTVPEDCVFVMGDNREDSLDSRYQSLGAVPYEAILGKAAFRFWPLSSFGSVYH